MCDMGISIAVSLAIAAAQAIAQGQSARSNAKSQKAYQEAQMQAHNAAAAHNANSAIKEQVEQSAAERTQQMQDQAAASKEMQKNQIDYMQKKGTAIASSPYGAGASFDTLMADYARAFATNNDVIQEQLQMQGVAHDVNLSSFRDRADGRIRSQQGYIGAPIQGPNPLATALGFASSAMGTYNSATNYGKDSLFKEG